MRLLCDRTGFPYVEWADEGLSLSLLPVTKVQFECFMAEQNEFDDAWYGPILSVNERVSWRRFQPETRARLFLTGVFPREALAFVHWLGAGYSLPTVEEWREFDKQMTTLSVETQLLRDCGLSVNAKAVIQQLYQQLCPRTWSDLALTRGGIAEWVQGHQDFQLMGQPPGTWWDPQDLNSVPVTPRQPDQRDGRFGFRPIRRMPVTEVMDF